MDEIENIPAPLDIAGEAMAETLNCTCAQGHGRVGKVTVGLVDETTVEVSYTIEIEHLPMCRYATSLRAALN